MKVYFPHQALILVDRSLQQQRVLIYTVMDSKRTPPLLRIWMLVTRCFAIPVAALSWVLHRRMGADPKRFSERLGRCTSPDRDPVLWFHAASLGEVMQIAPLAQYLSRSEKIKILVTTTTATGAGWVAREMPYAAHRFAPIDTPAAIRRFLEGWSISVAIFVEGELWPRLLGELHKGGVPQILLNARHSRTRARFPAVFQALLSTFSVITCRSETVAKGMRALGLPTDRIHVLPDLRLTLPKLAAPRDVLAPLSLAIGTRPVWLAASTHPADEEAVLAAQQEVLKTCPDALLILAPRHPNRGLPLHKLAQSKTLTTARRSLGGGVPAATQVYIADTLGELGGFFTLSPIAFLGGSFGQEGGHNPYEPAHFETGIVYGPHVKNFIDAYEALRLAGAAVQVEDPARLGEVIAGLLREDQAKAMGQAGLIFMENTKNCTLSYVDLIAGVLKRTAEHIDKQTL
jgi:3-deoxy-D-manno-octulosonic-acid transferase